MTYWVLLSPGLHPPETSLFLLILVPHRNGSFYRVRIH